MDKRIKVGIPILVVVMIMLVNSCIPWRYHKVRCIQGDLELEITVSSNGKRIEIKNVGGSNLGSLTIAVAAYESPLAHVSRGYMTLAMYHSRAWVADREKTLRPGEIWKIRTSGCPFKPQVFYVADNREHDSFWYGLHESLGTREDAGIPSYWR